MINDMDNFRGRGQWVFMQDGARSHTSHDTQNWLATKCKYIQKWPANSPDLNPIETLWGAMKKAVNSIKPKTVEDLKIIIQKVWDDFPQSKINDLVMSFYQRLHLIIQENGESIQTYIRQGLSQIPFISMPIQKDIPILDDVISNLIDNSDTEIIDNLQQNDADVINQLDIDISENQFSEENDQTNLFEQNEPNNLSFSIEEDKLIYELFMKYGPKWSKIAEFVKNKNPSQIKNRFRNNIQKKVGIDW